MIDFASSGAISGSEPAEPASPQSAASPPELTASKAPASCVSDTAMPRFLTEGRGRQGTLERLGDEIARLSAHITAATYRLLCLLREFDAREGWQEEGFRSCAQWLSWRTGTAPGAAREKLRVARALERLPALSEALRTGVLSYSAARALTRVATPENQAELVEVARHTTAAQLERLVRGWRALDRALEVEGERERHRQRALWVVPEADGTWAIRGRLDPEVGAVLCRALEAAEQALYARGAGGSGAEGEPGEEMTPAEARRADAVGLVAEAALGRGLGAQGARGERPSEVGTNPRPAPEASPAPGPGAEASTSTSAPASRPRPVVGRAERFQVVVHVSAETLGEATDGTGEPTNGTEVAREQATESRIEGGPHVSAETSRRVACDAGRVVLTHDGRGNVLNVGRRTRTVPPALRRALDHRDGGCRFPGCACRYCDAHHLLHWADGGETKLENLSLLCRRHHRLVHEEGWRVERREAGELRFYRPDGRLLPRVPVPPELGEEIEEEPGAALERAQRRLGIDEWTPTTRWEGHRMDLDWALFTLYAPRCPDHKPEGSSEGSPDSGPDLGLNPSPNVSAETSATGPSP